MSFRTERLGSHMAAAVSGIDLNRLPDAPTRAALLDVLHGNLVLCLRDQKLAPPAFRDAMAQFGAPMPAVGFGIDLDALAYATRATEARSTARERVLVIGDENKARELRARGIIAVVRREREGADEYARAWGFSKVVQ